VLYALRKPSSFTIVFTDWIAVAEASSSSTRAITSSLNGMDTEHPRMPSARTPPMAPARSVVVNAAAGAAQCISWWDGVRVIEFAVTPTSPRCTLSSDGGNSSPGGGVAAPSVNAAPSSRVPVTESR